MKKQALQLLQPDDIKLRKVCAEITLRELKTVRVQNFIEQMLDVVYGRNNKGKQRDRNKPMTVGLSANQTGILKRISVVDLAIGRKTFNDIHVLINPKIIWHSKTTSTNREGCVNIPKVWGIVKRYKEVKVEAFDRSGNKIMIHARGWAAILLQHEVDHLNGLLFIDHLPNPQKAHLVEGNELTSYRKNFRRWKKFTNISKLTKKHSRAVR
ncbi:MAG: peptide deformylase [bacterium]|nr:peptide deformylase [bacterium]